MKLTERSTLRTLVALLLLALAGNALSGQDLRSITALAADDPMLTGSVGFLSGHPDLMWRSRGLAAYNSGKSKVAYRYFLRAARYADKPSQAMLAEMLWSGTGTAADRPRAYVWMDLATERGGPTFIAWREHYWSQLTQSERERALEVGGELLNEYGDDAAKRRQLAAMRRTSRSATGSRTGYVGTLQVDIYAGQGGGGSLDNSRPVASFDGSKFYAQKYWDPDQYWAWQAEIWDQTPRGLVDVLPIQPDDIDNDEN